VNYRDVLKQVVGSKLGFVSFHRFEPDLRKMTLLIHQQFQDLISHLSTQFKSA